MRWPSGKKKVGCSCFCLFVLVASPNQTARVFKPRDDDDEDDGCERGCAADERRVCGHATGRKGQSKGDQPDPNREPAGAAGAASLVRDFYSSTRLLGLLAHVPALVRVEKYRPTTLDEVVSHKDITSTSRISFYLIYTCLCLCPINPPSRTVYSEEPRSSSPLLRTARHRQDEYDHRYCTSNLWPPVQKVHPRGKSAVQSTRNEPYHTIQSVAQCIG